MFYTHNSLICTTKVHTAEFIQPFCCCVVTQTPHYFNYRGDHAVVLLPGTAAAEEGDEENHHSDSDEDNGSSWGRRVTDHEGVVQSHLNQDSHDNQC